MTQQYEQVYVGRDNTALVTFSLNNSPIDFSAATRFLLRFGDFVIDSDINTGAITTTSQTGQIKFDLGNIPNIPTGQTAADFIVFDVDHPNGQVLACEIDDTLRFAIKDCD